MTGGEFKNTVFEQFSKIAHAFSSPKRLEIIDILTQGERDVATLAVEIGASVANTSRHLQVLKDAHLVKMRKQGVSVVYCLADPEVNTCWTNMRMLSENRLPEVRETVRAFFEEHDKFKAVPVDELLKRLECGEVVVLDVRPVEEYNAGHIPSAVSIPLEELKRRISELDRGKDIVVYCRGAYCVLSTEAVAIMREAGFKEYRTAEGISEWKTRKLNLTGMENN